MLSELNPWENRDQKARPIKDLEEVVLDLTQLDKVVQIATRLPAQLKTDLISFLREYKDIFLRSHHDMQVLTHQSLFIN